MRAIIGGQFQARLAETEDDLRAAQELRHLCFRGSRDGLDWDPFDDCCAHVQIEDRASGQLVGCFRLLHFGSGAEIDGSYSAQFYRLDGLSNQTSPMAEMGRFCIDPAFAGSADIPRLAWAALVAWVEARGVEWLFGCSSFQGIEPAEYEAAFSLLHARFLAPPEWRPEPRAPLRHGFGDDACDAIDQKQALAQMPTLLRSYLVMGGRVSDHAVVDHDLQTMHVFTGLELSAVPAPRLRSLRSLVG